MPRGTKGQPAAPRLQPRDYELLRGLFECRMMTLAHATALHFAGRYDAACKRVQSLKSAGYVGDRRARVGEPSLLYLTKRAFEYLTAEGKLDGYPRLTPEQFARRSRVSDATVRHELAVMDVRVALTVALAAATTLRIDAFTSWPLLSQFAAVHPVQRQRVIVQPDGFLSVSAVGVDPEEYNFFLELDRSNEVQRVLVEKVLCYRDFFASGGFAARYGATPAEFKRYPFRILIVLQNPERRNNLAERLVNCAPPVKYHAWLTTQAEVLADPLGRIWACPADYAHATAGTIYAPEHWRGTGEGYARRPERERLVEERIVKRTLFEEAAVAPPPPSSS